SLPPPYFTFTICFVRLASEEPKRKVIVPALLKMFDDQDLGFFANFLGIFIFILVIAYHFVVADPKFE
ncbi:hypothetical protein N665_0002s0236, partial [Sinapis alba]